MPEAITISTSKYITTANVKIDKRVYVVRKIGAGEQLDLSTLMGEAQEQSTELMNLRGKYAVATGEEKQKIASELVKAMKPFQEIKDKIEEIYIGLFDDGEDGKHARKLVKSLGMDKVAEMYNEIVENVWGKGNAEEESA